MTLYSDMLHALEDEDSSIKDVTLIGSDGVRVSASKAVLAIRSPVFKRMFFGQFQEASSNEVPMDYRGVVLQVVVKYCFIDELDLDLFATEEADCMTDEEAVAMVQARDAANYLELFELHKILSNELGESILADQADLGCVCAILQELMARGGTEEPMWATCADPVEANPDACFFPKGTTHNQGILSCSLHLLEILWESTKMDAFTAVKALQKWNQDHDTSQESQPTLQKLADKVKLEEIAAKNLSVIKPCALFSMERLYHAFVHHGKFDVAAKTPISWKSPSNHPLVARVSGAGVECANGVYTWVASAGFGSNNAPANYYQMVGNYGDLPSSFRLKKDEHSGWKVIVATGQDNSQELVLYESSAGSATKPSFALWKCVDGKEPTPYVSVHGPPQAKSGGFAFNFSSPPPESNMEQVADAFRAQASVNNSSTRTEARRRVRSREPGR